jgi:nucleoside-diphosphate-sugar epimerase
VLKLIFGCGYLGLRVADRWVAGGTPVCAVTRERERVSSLQSRGIEPIVGDIMASNTLRRLPAADTVLFAVGHDRRCGHSIRELYVDGLRNVLEHLPRGVSRFIYVSSTGVFGQSDGNWVDETSPCEPTREGGRACWQAELLLQQHPLGGRAVVLRMAGLYGPGRIPRGKELQAGLPIDAPSEGYLNLIHVDDAASAVLAADERAPLPSLYCVSDGHPVMRRDYYCQLAALLGAAEPQLREPRHDAPAALRASASKRVSNQRLISQLGCQLQYPSYREGLAAIITTAAAPIDTKPAGRASENRSS